MIAIPIREWPDYIEALEMIAQEKTRANDVEARMGWELAQCRKEMSALEEKVEKLQDKLEKCTREKAASNKKAGKLASRVGKSTNQMKRLRSRMKEVRNTALDLCNEHTLSAMTATIHNDSSVPELLAILPEYLDNSKKRLRARYRMQMQEMQNTIDSRTRQNAELQQALHECDQESTKRLHILESHRASISHAALESSTIQNMVHALRQTQLSFCHHPELNAFSLTQCGLLLCKGCDKEIRKDACGDVIIGCSWCRNDCFVLPLPKLFSVPRISDWEKIVNELAIVSRLKGLTDDFMRG